MRSVLQPHDTDKIYHIRGDINVGDVAADGGQLRPHIVWFNEPVPQIIQAKSIMKTADIFVLVGSSMQVYPASGLINYVRPQVTKYVIDKKIPYVITQPELFLIEKPATQGVRELYNLLTS